MGLKAAVQRGAVQLELGFIELQPEPAVCQLALSLCIGHQSRSIQIPGAMGRRPKVPLIIPASAHVCFWLANGACSGQHVCADPWLPSQLLLAARRLSSSVNQPGSRSSQRL